MDATPTPTPTHAPAATSAQLAGRPSGPRLRLARAYADPAPAAQDAPPSPSPDTVSFSFPRDPLAQAAMPARARALLAGSVPAPADPGADHPTRAAGSMAFYRHPADRNTAATAIAAGSTLDVRG